MKIEYVYSNPWCNHEINFILTQRDTVKKKHNKMNLNGTPKEDPAMQNKIGKLEEQNPERTNRKQTIKW